MKRLNGGEYLLDLSNATIDDGALLGVNDEFLSLFPIVRGNLKKNHIFIKMNGIIIPCTYSISGLILTISGIFNNGENGVILLTIACEYDVDEYDVVFIDSITIATKEKENIDSALFEEIKDEEGHNRFIEGDLETKEITGVSYSYARWSLSGTHLLIVLAGNIADTSVITNGDVLADLGLPSWIVDKVYAVFSTVIDFKSTPTYASNWSTQSLITALRKSGGDLHIVNESTTTWTADRSFRIAYDLLIDNE